MKRPRKPADPAVAKLGRPRLEDEAGEMVKVSFRLDRHTYAVLEELERIAGPSIRGRRSVLLRRLILNAGKPDNQGETTSPEKEPDHG